MVYILRCQIKGHKLWNRLPKTNDVASQRLAKISNVYILNKQYFLSKKIEKLLQRLTQKSLVAGSILGPAIYFRFSSAESRRIVVSYRRNNVHCVLGNRFGRLSLTRNSMVRLTVHPT